MREDIRNMLAKDSDSIILQTVSKIDNAANIVELLLQYMKSGMLRESRKQEFNYDLSKKFQDTKRSIESRHSHESKRESEFETF